MMNTVLSLPIVSLSEAVVEDGMVKAAACLIEQGWSLNGRYYATPLLRKLAPLLEGAGSFDGHVSSPRVTDYLGAFSHVGVEEGAGPTGRDAIKGIFSAFDPRLQRLLRFAPHLVALSVNGKGRVAKGRAEGREGLIVEDVDSETPWTCDAVLRAGARGGIDEVLEALDESDEALIDFFVNHLGM